MWILVGRISNFPFFSGETDQTASPPPPSPSFLPWFNRCSPSSRSRCIPRDAQVFLQKEIFLHRRLVPKSRTLIFVQVKFRAFYHSISHLPTYRYLFSNGFAKHVRSSFIIMQIGERKREGEKGGSRFFFNGNLHVNPININERVTLRIP